MEKPNFRIGVQEAVGFGILGGTAGSLLAGATHQTLGLTVIPAMLSGALLLPFAVMLPWRRLLPARKNQRPTVPSQAVIANQISWRSVK